MTKRQKFLTVILTLILALVIYNSFYPDFLIVGEYQSRVTDTWATDGIDDGETLILNDDGTFYNPTMGKGTYTVSGARIDFDFKDEGWNTYFYRPFFIGRPRIVIFRDSGAEFEKVKKIKTGHNKTYAQ